MPTTPTPDLTETQALILLLLGRNGRLDQFQGPRQAGLDRFEDYSRQMGVLEKQGLVEHRVVGSRVRHWRLTQAGQHLLVHASRVSHDAYTQRVAQWRQDNEVYGQPRPADAPPLTAPQQRAWVLGWAAAQLEQASVPKDAPAEVRARFESLRANVLKRVRPHFPLGAPGAPESEPGKPKPRA